MALFCPSKGEIAMSDIPTTSTTLLRNLAEDSQHARWDEFVARYRPMMEAFMRESFPSVDADEVIQRTLLALVQSLPSYRYVPDEKGSFHNYLTGILRHRALRLIAEERRRGEVYAAFAGETPSTDTAKEIEDRAWRESLFEIALQQYLADDSVQDRTKQIFTRIAVNGEKPDDVAASFGMKRNAVDQIKNRATERLRELVKALEQASDA